MVLATNPTKPRPSARNRRKKPYFPACDSLPIFQMMSSIQTMSPPTPMMRDQDSNCSIDMVRCCGIRKRRASYRAQGCSANDRDQISPVTFEESLIYQDLSQNECRVCTAHR